MEFKKPYTIPNTIGKSVGWGDHILVAGGYYCLKRTPLLLEIFKRNIGDLCRSHW